MNKFYLIAAATFLFQIREANGQKITIDRNKPERVELFSAWGFGIKINWSVDVQMAGADSELLSGSSTAFQDAYFNDLPMTFNPQGFDPEEWAKTAKLAGVQYMIFSAKEANGFCMWDTQSSAFNVMNTAFGKDILKLTLDAFRDQGIAVGISFSPNDYYTLYKQGLSPSRESDASLPTNNTALWETDKMQLRELLTGYGKIDLLSVEESADWANPLAANYAWDLDSELIITRGGMETFAFKIPEIPPMTPWEVFYTMGFQRYYEPGEKLKDAGSLISLLVETRAKGGNFLLNVTPNAIGEIPESQDVRLREIGSWMMSNREAVINVKPWEIPNEQDIWFTGAANPGTVYATTDASFWKLWDNKAYFIRCVGGSRNTKISLLGQKPSEAASPERGLSNPYFSVTEKGIFINIVNTRKTVNEKNYPAVIKLEGITFSGKFRN